MGYTKQAIAGFSWQSVLKVATALLTLAKISILARLLHPNDFGLFSLTAVALGITESLTQTGINLTIIQAKESVRYFLDTAWVIAIIRGLAIGVIMVGVAGGMGWWYQQPAIVPLIMVAALVPVIKGFINPAIVGLHKNLQFFQDSLYRFSLALVEAVVAVGAGMWLHSVWALLLGLLGAAVFEVVISFVYCKDKPSFRYSATKGATIIKNGRWLGIATILNYLNENLDNVLLGKLVGTYQLGLYQNAYALSHKVNYEVAKSIHHGVIPIYAKICDDPTRLKPAFQKSLATTLFLGGLGSVPLFLFPDLVVHVVLGSQWGMATTLVPWLGLAGLTQSISASIYSLYLAKRHYHHLNLHLWCTLIGSMGLLVWWGSQSGLLGAVQGIVVGRLSTVPLLLWGMRWSLNHPVAPFREKT